MTMHATDVCKEHAAIAENHIANQACHFRAFVAQLKLKMYYFLENRTQYRLDYEEDQ